MPCERYQRRRLSSYLMPESSTRCRKRVGEPDTLCAEEWRFKVVKNEKNEIIPQRTMTGWRMCTDYRKLNKATKKDHPRTVHR
jgi:hypothetical protein